MLTAANSRDAFVDNTALAAEFLTLAGHRCHEQAEDLAELMDITLGPSDTPAHAPARTDRTALLGSARSAERGRLWISIDAAYKHLLVHTIDHIRTLGTNLIDHLARVPVFAHAGMARGAVESAGMLMYLLADGEPFEARLARGVALLIVDAAEEEKAAAQIPHYENWPSPGSEATRDKDALLALIDRALIERILNQAGTRTKGVRVAPYPEVPVRVTATDLARRYFADMPAVYSLLSGVVHGLPSGLTRSAKLCGDGVLWSPDPVDVGGSAVVALTAASRAGAALAAWRGVSDHPIVTLMAERPTITKQELLTFGIETDAFSGDPMAARYLTPP
jgi:hypothetical protein